MSNLDDTAAILAQHQRRTDNGRCWCDEWPAIAHDETWMMHVARALHPTPTPTPKPTARPPHPDTMAGRL